MPARLSFSPVEKTEKALDPHAVLKLSAGENDSAHLILKQQITTKIDNKLGANDAQRSVLGFLFKTGTVNSWALGVELACYWSLYI
eukprot:1178184-Prorocentrum_minimum.AAC.10